MLVLKASPLAVSALTSNDEVLLNVGAAGLDLFVDDSFGSLGGFDDTAIPSTLNVSAATSMTLNAQVGESVNADVLGGNSVLTATDVAVSGADGSVSLSSEYDVVLADTDGILINGGSTAGDSTISVTAGRYIANEESLDFVSDPLGNAGGDLGAKSVNLTASTFNADPLGSGYVYGSIFDTAETVSVTSTAPTGQIFLEFDRATSVELDGINSDGSIFLLNTDTVTAAEVGFVIGAGGVTAGATASVGLEADGDIASTEETGVVAGSISGGSAVLFTAADVDVNTAVTDLSVDAEDVTIVQTGDLKVSPGTDSAGVALPGVTALNDASITVTGGGILESTGVLDALNAVVTTANGIDLLTSVDSLVANAESGVIEIIESDGLTIGTGGITSTDDVSITLTLGALSSSLQTITGDDVAVSLLDPLANDIDILTNANSVTAAAANGNIIIENVGNFSVGDDGILADDGTPGDAVFNDVTLKSTGGSMARELEQFQRTS